MVILDEKPPPAATTDSPVTVSEKKWIPPSSLRRAPHTEQRNDAVFRKVRGILNKLAPEKFNKLCVEVLNVGIGSQVILKGVILLIFEKALEEPKYSSLYAQLCLRLCKDAPNFEPASSQTTTFRRLLLNKCQDEFENRSKATEAFDKDGAPLTPEEHEQLSIAKRKMLGNIKFIGELGKLEMLHEGILHRCIKQLLDKKRKVPVKDMAEDLECLCQIMRTVGRRLDSDKAKAWMNKYFCRMQAFMDNEELPSRIRFMLQDVLELRANKWKPRRIGADGGPKTIQQVREEAAVEYGVYFPPHGMTGPLGDLELFSRPMNGFGSNQRGGGMADMFGVSPSFYGAGGIGTGPGVIPLDFAPPFSGGVARRSNQHNQGQYQQRREGSPRFGRDGQQQQQRQGQYQQQQQQGNRELPPRFRRLQQQQQPQSAFDDAGGTQPPTSQNSHQSSTNNQGRPAGREEISLRPAKNFTPMFRPNIPNMLPKSAQAPMPSFNQSQQAGRFMGPGGLSMNSVSMTTPPLHKQAQITIKQMPASDKSKENKKKTPSKEDLKQATENLLKELLDTGNVDGALFTAKELGAPNRYLSELVSYLILETLDRSDTDRENVSKLLIRLKEEDVVMSDQYMEGLNVVLEKMAELQTDVPLVKSFVAKLAAQAVAGGVITLTELAEPVTNGAHYPLFLLCLQQLYKLKDKDWLTTTFTDSKINLQSTLPECDQNKERIMEILEDRGLSFMFPLLRVQADLWKQIKADPTPANIYKWTKDNVEPKLYTTPGFINVLVSNILRYVTAESTLPKGADPSLVPDKFLIEKEKDLLGKFKSVLQVYLHDKVDLQVVTIYTLQVHCYNNSFPKGMLLRLFMLMYDLEVIEEEAYLKWKEEVNDEYPGKGKALFQVNQWLMWLEQAEEETDEEDD